VRFLFRIETSKQKLNRSMDRKMENKKIASDTMPGGSPQSGDHFSTPKSKRITKISGL